jgi:hypothetical protein
MTCRVFGPPVRVDESPEDDTAQGCSTDGFAVCELCFTQASPEEIAAAEMIVPHADEQELLNRLAEIQGDGIQPSQGSTIIAYCLTLQPAPPQPS